MRPGDPHGPGRTASTLELFFDLVVMAAIVATLVLRPPLQRAAS